MLPKEIFKAYDIRGVVDKSLSEEVVTLIGQALGTEALVIGQTSIIVGRDGRLSGPRLGDALAEGIMAAGCDVIDIGQAPTPAIYFASFHLGTQSAVAITLNRFDFSDVGAIICHHRCGSRAGKIRSSVDDFQVLQGIDHRRSPER
jgi:phosphomannomutase